MLKSSHRRTRKQARRPKLETLEKRQLFAGDIAGVTAAAADATIKSDLQAVYAAPVAKTSVIEQTGNKDGDVLWHDAREVRATVPTEPPCTPQPAQRRS